MLKSNPIRGYRSPRDFRLQLGDVTVATEGETRPAEKTAAKRVRTFGE